MPDTEITPAFLVLGSMWLVVFLFSATMHEAAHAWAALRGGDPTAYMGGQVSLDPMPHLQREPVGMLVAPIVSFFLLGGYWMMGWASAPYDPFWAMRHPRRAAWMALAGPAANLLLVIAALVAIRIGLGTGALQAPAVGDLISPSTLVHGASTTAQTVATLLSILFSLNLVLFVFNLLPVPPLDGAAALPLLLGDSTAGRYQSFMSQPMMPMAGLLLAWLAFPRIFDPIFDGALLLLYAGVA